MIRYLIEIDTGDEIIRASSACRDPLNPSDIRYTNALNERIPFPVRLEIPSINQKISDSISGTTILNQYSVNLINDDGRYDDLVERKITRGIVVLYRSDKENATLSDFDVISTGKVDYPVIGENKATLYINSIFRSLTEEVCKIFTTDDYPNLPDNLIDKQIPIGYGPGLNNLPLFQIDSTDLTKYLILDPDYITAVDTVYDEDGNSISFTGPDVNGIITATDAKSADVQGLLNNSIGEMIAYEMEQKSSITYDSTNWDTSEAGVYLATSAKLNYYVTSGTVRAFINGALKSDNAFLFTKNNGLLTIRQWGIVYNLWNVPSWNLMQFNNKDYKDSSKHFTSSSLIKYNKDHGTGIHQSQYIDATKEADIELLYGRQERVEYPTDLYLQPEVEDLASRLVTRFGSMSPNIRIGISMSTANVNLLDILYLPVTIGRAEGARTIATEEYWVVRECNPGQDVVYVEALSDYDTPDVIDGVLSMPLTEEISSGVLSEPISEDKDGNLSQPVSVKI